MTNLPRIIIGGVLGAIAGYAIYRFIGCRTGTCPLNSNPFIAMALWGLMGALMASDK
jgi:hypothetical protein